MNKARILVVEDELVVSRDIVGQLQSLGYSPVGEVVRGEDAIALTEQLHPDLVLMDIQLAGSIDGIAAAMEIRRRCDVPVVFLTAFSAEQLLERAKKAEPFGYIVKPFDERHLRIVVEMALERHSVEIRLRNSEGAMQAVLQTAMDSFWTLDADGHILTMNDAACRLSGYSREELTGLAISKLAYGQTPEQIRTAIAHVIQTRSAQVEREVRRKDGEIRLIEISVTCLSNPASKLYCFGRDITERRQGEERLRQLHRAVEQSPVSIVVTDVHGAITYVNPCFEHVTGYTTAEVMGMNPRVLKSGEHTVDFYREMWAVISSGREWRGAFRNRKKNGELYWENAVVSPVRDDHGIVSHFIAVKEDITIRKRTEEVLAQRDSYLSAIIENQPGFRWLKDASGRFLAVNRAFAIFCGRSNPNDLVGLTDFDIWPRKVADIYREWDLDVLRNQSSRSVEEIVPVGADQRWFETFKAPVCDADGRVIGITGYAIDITDRKHAEMRMQQSKTELEHANAQLQAAIKQSRELTEAAQSANRAKSAFLTSMSHELRTPLNVINGLAATLVEQVPSEEHRQSLSLVLESGQNLLSIIEEILDYSGLQAGAPRIEPKPFDLAAVVSQALRLAGEAAKRRRIQLSYWIDPTLPAAVVSDPRRIQQILINLLTNGIRATARGRVHLACSARPHPAGWRLGFSVADCGPGYPADEISRLFEPFARADGQPGAPSAGAGLGLTIVRSYANLLGGDVALRTRVDRGSVFRCHVIVGAVPSAASALAALAPTAARGHTALIVVPDPRKRRLLQAAAQAWGLQARIARSAEVSPELLDQTPPITLAIIDPEAVRQQQGALARWLSPVGAGHGVPVAWLYRPHPPTLPVLAAPTVNLSGPLDLSELARALASFSVPRTKAPIAGAASAKPPKLGERLPLRILAADDIRTNREMIFRMFQHLGYTLTLAENGAEVLAALKVQAFDLLLLDVQMPVMDGLAAAREICRLHPEPTRRPKMVALTANALPGDRETCLAAGMDDYLTKPVLPKEIEACFLRLFAAPGPAVVASTTSIRSGELPWVDQHHLENVMPGLEAAQALETLTHLHDAAAGDFRQLWPKIVDACAQHDGPHLAELVHGLKGCFLMLGWTRITTFCIDAIAQARKGEFTAWESFPGDLKQFYNSSTAAMTDFLSDMAATREAPAGAPAESPVKS